MEKSRRQLLAGAAAATVGAAAVGNRAAAAAPSALPSADAIAALFAGLPGTLAFRIVAPATARTKELDVSRDPAQQLFVASAVKVFIAVEALRQEDSPGVSATLDGRKLSLDATVWTAGSPTFDPPNLTGQVSERTALDAMIAHSDDTATDIVLSQVGADNVRQLLVTAGLRNTLIADRTRAFFGYLKGAADYETFTWDQLVATADDPFVEAPLNTTITFASTADDLVSFYEQAMRGDFFEHDETLKLLRSLMSTGDVVWATPMPIGTSSFGKGGSFDVPGFHALSAPGAMFFDEVWVYFSFILNWNAPEAMDATTLAPFLSATAEALQLVKDALAAPLSCDPPARLPATR